MEENCEHYWVDNNPYLDIWECIYCGKVKGVSDNHCPACGQGSYYGYCYNCGYPN